jgi:hypothetical protein
VNNITGNFLNRILELFSMVDTVSAPSMSGILKLTILLTIDNLDRRMLRQVMLIYNTALQTERQGRVVSNVASYSRGPGLKF